MSSLITFVTSPSLIVGLGIGIVIGILFALLILNWLVRESFENEILTKLEKLRLELDGVAWHQEKFLDEWRLRAGSFDTMREELRQISGEFDRSRQRAAHLAARLEYRRLHPHADHPDRNAAEITTVIVDALRGDQG